MAAVQSDEMMGFGEAIKTCLSKFADFGGRATRAEFWWFMLFYFIVSVVTGFAGPFVSALVALALLLPTLGVQVRRLHDIGRSGWWILVGLVPLIGWLVLLYWAVQPSEGANQYG